LIRDYPLSKSDLLICGNGGTVYKIQEVFGLTLGPASAEEEGEEGSERGRERGSGRAPVGSHDRDRNNGNGYDADADADADDSGVVAQSMVLLRDAECVVCLSDPKAVILLPCR
jgi:hypothetical protein